jgi:cytochrome P450
MAMLAAANMDFAANARPEQLDLERRPNRHLSFGRQRRPCVRQSGRRLHLWRPEPGSKAYVRNSFVT